MYFFESLWEYTHMKDSILGCRGIGAPGVRFISGNVLSAMMVIIVMCFMRALYAVTIELSHLSPKLIILYKIFYSN